MCVSCGAGIGVLVISGMVMNDALWIGDGDPITIQRRFQMTIKVKAKIKKFAIGGMHPQAYGNGAFVIPDNNKPRGRVLQHTRVICQ